MVFHYWVLVLGIGVLGLGIGVLVLGIGVLVLGLPPRLECSALARLARLLRLASARSVLS